MRYTYQYQQSNQTHNRKQTNNYKFEGTHLNVSNNLSLEQHKQVFNLLQEFIHLFATNTSKVKPAIIDPCEIKLKLNYTDPKFNFPHRVSPQQRDELITQLDKLLDADIIRPVISKFAAPVFLVKKGKGFLLISCLLQRIK